MKTINWIRLGLGVVLLIAVFALGWEFSTALVVVTGAYEFIINKKEGELEAQLVDFGNFLLSPFREKRVSKTNINSVTDADLQNWRELKKGQE